MWPCSTGWRWRPYSSPSSAAQPCCGDEGRRGSQAIGRGAEPSGGVAPLDALNQAEGLDGSLGWGGADNVGGAPRGRGSALSPDQVERVINQVIQSRRGDPGAASP